MKFCHVSDHRKTVIVDEASEVMSPCDELSAFIRFPLKEHKVSDSRLSSQEMKRAAHNSVLGLCNFSCRSWRQ